MGRHGARLLEHRAYRPGELVDGGPMAVSLAEPMPGKVQRQDTPTFPERRYLKQPILSAGTETVKQSDRMAGLLPRKMLCPMEADSADGYIGHGEWVNPQSLVSNLRSPILGFEIRD